jgi:hypothetical protein
MVALPALSINMPQEPRSPLDVPQLERSFAFGNQLGEQTRERNLLKDVGSSAASGNYLAAAQKAMRGGDLSTGLQLQKHASSMGEHDTEKKLKLLDFFTRGAQGADTPEKWSALLNMAQGVYGPSYDITPFSDFGMRDQVISFLSDSKSSLERQKLQLGIDLEREKLAEAREGRAFKSNMLSSFGLTPQGVAPSATPPMAPPTASPASPMSAAPPVAQPPDMGAEPGGSRSTQEIVAHMTPAQRTSLGLLLAKEDYAGAAKLIQAASGEAERTPPSGYRWSQTRPGELEAIAGGPQSKLPADVAGKVGMMRVAVGNMPRIREIFLGQEGEADPKTGKPTRKGANVRLIPYYATAGEIGHGIRLTTGAIESVLRAASGAAVPEQEVTRYQSLFLPSPYDTEITKARKLDELENWIGTMLSTIQEGRPVSLDEAHRLAQARSQVSGAAPTNSGPRPGTVEDGHRFKGGNPADPNNWEPL